MPVKSHLSLQQVLQLNLKLSTQTLTHALCILFQQAPYLPWVLLGFSVLLGNPIWVDLMGMIVGHCYYFMEDVFPNQPGGFRILKTPQFL